MTSLRYNKFGEILLARIIIYIYRRRGLLRIVDIFITLAFFILFNKMEYAANIPRIYGLFSL